MKKEILNNNADFFEIKYIISKNRYAILCHDWLFQDKSLMFIKKTNKIRRYHRPCNLGFYYRNKRIRSYMENDKYHNLYGPAYINKAQCVISYFIYGKEYEKAEFHQYLAIYNKLYYKRIY